MRLLEAGLSDVRQSLRSLAHSPGFTIAAVLTLALGIGAVSTMFTVVKSVLLAPLPYEQPERRVAIWSRWVGFERTWLSEYEVLDYRRLSKTLDDVAAWGTGQVNLTGDGDPVRVGAGTVTANTFAVLGANPMLGRAFTTDEDRPGQTTVAVLGYGLWQLRYGGDPNVVGRTIQVDGVPRTIVGVMPRGFKLPTDFGEDAAEPTQLWLPLGMDLANAERGNHGLYGAARLAPGATAESATAELTTLTANMTRQGLYPADMKFSAFAVSLEEEIRGAVRPALLLLFGAVAFLLLIASTNVASLLLVRGDARQREIALRVALGASPGRIARQLLTESLTLALISAVAGLALAQIGLRVLSRLQTTRLPQLAPAALDGWVVLFTAVVAIVTTIVCGMVPVVRAARLAVTESLKDGSHSSSGPSHRRMRGLLVMGELALAVMLVIGAGLMVRSLAALRQVDLGFEPANVLTLSLALSESAYEEPGQVIAFYDTLIERVRALPGVRQAGLIRSVPLANSIGDWGLMVEGYVPPPGDSAKGDWQIASDGALEAIGERLKSGRLFTRADTADSQQVAVVNETMARMYWRDGNPVGRQMRMGGPDRPWLTVVGVVGDVRHNGIDMQIKGKFYRPFTQFHRSSGRPYRNMTIVMKTEGEPLALAPSVAAIVRALDSSVPVANVRTMDAVVTTAMTTPRLTGFVLGTFALLALVLAAVGTYGVMAYVVSQRTREIAIRMAIGADRRDMFRLMFGQAAWLALPGIAVGMIGAFGLTRLMQTLLYTIKPTDPVTFLMTPAILTVTALVASALPAFRAARVNPITALRSQ